MNNDLWLEVKYVNLISNKVQRFRKIGDHKWACRCPLCGDSKKSTTKTRGNFYQYKGSMIFHCHNCGQSRSLPDLLKDVDTFLYQEFLLEKFGKVSKPKQDPIFETNTATVFDNNSILRGIKSIASLDDKHPAKKYVIKRRIPSKHHRILFYCPKFTKWVNELIPKKLPEFGKDEPRLIIPFYDKDGNIFGFQGRSFEKNPKIRYITIMLSEDQQKIYGLDRLNTKEQVFVVEGPLDSLFLDNSIASADGSLYSGMDSIGVDQSNIVLIFDNEPRNKNTVKKMDKAINIGYSVVIWPNDIKEKDINDMVLSGRNISGIIQVNIYKGLEAKLKLNDWKRVSI